MTKSSKQRPRSFWMDTDLLDKALDSCDLGDGYSAKVRQYPHKDMLPELTHVIEASYANDLEAKLAVAVKALDKIGNPGEQSLFACREAARTALEQLKKAGLE